MTEDVQVNLRLPIPLKEKLQNIAKENSRSLNAELNERLLASLETAEDNYSTAVNTIVALADRFQTSNRVIDIKNRLQFLLDEAQKIPHAPFLTPALIASKLGYEYATETEKWFEGQLEPSFSQLKQLANFFGCNESWLQFGMDKPFLPKHYSHFRSVVDVVDFCTTPTDGVDKVREILIIRNDSTAGEILIIKVFNSYSCQLYQTPVHLSEVNGATGTHYRAILTLALEALNRSLWKLKIKSFLVKPPMYETLIAGEQNPLHTMARIGFSHWMDDIWDSSMYNKADNSYWQGWQKLCRTIASDIQHDQNLSEDKASIGNLSHQAITLLNARFYQYFD